MENSQLEYTKAAIQYIRSTTRWTFFSYSKPHLVIQLIAFTRPVPHSKQFSMVFAEHYYKCAKETNSLLHNTYTGGNAEQYYYN